MTLLASTSAAALASGAVGASFKARKLVAIIKGSAVATGDILSDAWQGKPLGAERCQPCEGEKSNVGGKSLVFTRSWLIYAALCHRE